MKKKTITLVIGVMSFIMITSLLIFAGCKKKTVEVIKTVTDTVVVIQNPSLADATNNGSDVIDCSMGQYTPNTPADSGKWKLDKAHCNVGWETQYTANAAFLTGRFNMFNFNVNFDEAHPANTWIKAWVQLSTFNTGEPGRDGFSDGSNPLWGAAATQDNVRWDSTINAVTTNTAIPTCKFWHQGCGQGYMGVKFDTAKKSNGKIDIPLPKYTPKASTDTAWFVSTGCVKTSNYYTVTGDFTFRGVTKTVSMKMGYYKRWVIPASSGPTKTDKAGIYGEFTINANTVFGVNSTSINDLVTIRVNCNMVTNKYTGTNSH